MPTDLEPQLASQDTDGLGELMDHLNNTGNSRISSAREMTTTANPGLTNSIEDSIESPRHVHGVAWLLVVVATISSMFLFGLDQTITAVVQPAITQRFNSIEKLPWVSVALLLGASASNLFWGQVYANYNAKWIFLVCFVVFEIGSALCGASPTIDVLIAGRALCGFGGTGMYNGVVSFNSPFITFPAENRQRYWKHHTDVLSPSSNL